MIIGIVGRQGHGKTLMMSLFAYYLSKSFGVPIHANYTLKDSTRLKSLVDLTNVKDSILCVDEMHVEMDSREFSKNVDLTVWINQARKNRLHVMYTTQHQDQVDKRLQRATDILIQCQKVHGDIWVTFIDNAYGEIQRRVVIRNPSLFYFLYDTFDYVTKLK